MKGMQQGQQQKGQGDVSLFDQFAQAIGASGQPHGANQNIGLQFANAPQSQTPSAQAMMGALPQVNQQARNLPTFNPLLQMLISGGK